MKPSLLTNAFVKTLSLTVLLAISSASIAQANSVDLNKLIPAAPKIEASSYILMDHHSGQVLTELNADDRRDPASLTKMMTSYIIGQAINSGKIKSDDTVVISSEARSTNPKFLGSSLMFIKKNSRISVADLNRGIVIQSGNDACVAMAEHISGNQDSFVSLMNMYSENLGLKNSRFETVHGLDAENQYSTARDMAILGQALIRDVPDEYAIYKEKEFTFSDINQKNRNRLLWDKSMNVDGIKTGHTAGAGYNLVSSATEGPMRLIAVVMGSKSEALRQEQSKQLLTWGFRNFESVIPIPAKKEVMTQRVWFGANSKVSLGVIDDFAVTIPKGRLADLKSSYTLNNNELHAPITKGQVIGTISYSLDEQVVAERSLVALDEVNEGGFFSKIIEYILLLFNRWFG